jgi:hypothetical protein
MDYGGLQSEIYVLVLVFGGIQEAQAPTVRALDQHSTYTVPSSRQLQSGYWQHLALTVGTWAKGNGIACKLDSLAFSVPDCVVPLIPPMFAYVHFSRVARRVGIRSAKVFCYGNSCGCEAFHPDRMSHCKGSRGK